MPKKITPEQLNESIEKAKTEIRQGENLINQMRREVSKEERTLRTRRLIERGAIAESLISGADTLTNEQFKTLLSAGLHTGAAREVLEHFRKQNGETVVRATLNNGV